MLDFQKDWKVDNEVLTVLDSVLEQEQNCRTILVWVTVDMFITIVLWA